jgi:hypothetical protein
MKKTKQPLNQRSRFKSGSAIIAGVALVAFGYAAIRIFAASGTASLSLTPAIGTYAPGQAVDVKVNVNTGGGQVNAVEADFTYPTAQLQYKSVDDAGSVFGLSAFTSASGGTIKLARATNGGTPPYTGTGLVATIHFTALASGSASLAFLTSSHVLRSTDSTDILATTTGAVYTIAVQATPAPTPGHTPTPTPAKTTTPAPKTGTGATPTTSPTASVVAGAGAPSTDPSGSIQPQATSTVVTVPTTKTPKRVDVLGVKVAGIPVLAVAIVIVLAAIAGVTFMFNRYKVPENAAGSGDTGAQPTVTPQADTTTPPAPAPEPAPAQVPPSQPILPNPQPTPPATEPTPAPAEPSPAEDTQTGQNHDGQSND